MFLKSFSQVSKKTITFEKYFISEVIMIKIILISTFLFFCGTIPAKLSEDAQVFRNGKQLLNKKVKLFKVQKKSVEEQKSVGLEFLKKIWIKDASEIENVGKSAPQSNVYSKEDHKRASSEEHEFNAENKHGKVIHINQKNAIKFQKDNTFELRIHKNGRRIKYQTKGQNSTLHNQAFSLEQKEAFKKARSIVKKLKLIPDNEEAQLFDLRVVDEHFTGRFHDKGDRIISKIVVFGRKLNGLPVVGRGTSQVIIKLGVDDPRIEDKDLKSVRSIDVDWPEFIEIATEQEFADVKEIDYRSIGVLAHQSKIETNPTNTITFYETEIDFEVTDEFCGYVDLGATSASLIQLGCLLIGKKNSRFPEIHLIPAGKDIQHQKDWAMTSKEKNISEVGKIVDSNPRTFFRK
jgi:hypothetical protein